MKLVIDRSRWLRGEGPQNSWLKRQSDGKQCCLGFLGDQCGVPYGLARGPEHAHGRWPEALFYESTFADQYGKSWTRMAVADVTVKLMDVNDAEACAPTHRENCITELFASIGIDAEFVDGPTTISPAQ